MAFRAIRAILWRFFYSHTACLGTGNWEGVVPVPSTWRRGGVHPLCAALSTLPGLAVADCVELVDASRLGRGIADEEAFGLRSDVSGRRLVVVDDTWTSGATAQSVASRLALGGAKVVAVVAVGRVVRPNSSSQAARLWKATGSVGFCFSRCWHCQRHPDELLVRGRS